MAYCLLGILGVNMPLLYGEGVMAFRRLQEETLRRNNDITLLAWGRPPDGWLSGFIGVLAPEPSDFLNCGLMSKFADDSDSISITNKGLFFSGDVPMRVVAPIDGGSNQYMLCLGSKWQRGHGMEGIVLSKISPSTFCRIGAGTLNPSPAVLNDNPNHCFQRVCDLSHTDFYILTDPSSAMAQAMRHRHKGIHLPDDPNLSLITATPQVLWDATDRMFIRPKPYGSHFPIHQALAMLIIYEIGGQLIELVILCNYENSIPDCELFSFQACPRSLRRALHLSDSMTSFLWSDLESADSLPGGQQHVDVSANGRNVRIALVLDEVGEAPSPWNLRDEDHLISGIPFPCFTLRLKCHDLP
jgi:hypothetical protein